MKKVLLMAACAVLVTGVVANAGDVALSLVDTGGASSGSAAPGSYTLEVRALVTPTAGEGGLALFGFDFDGPVPLVSDQFTTTLTSFVKDEGLTNPAGFGGTLSGSTLLQVGGGQNTIGYTGTTPSYPTGTVVAGIGLSETTIASIVLDTSALAEGDHVFQISNGFANLIDPASQPSAPPYTVSAANMLAGSPTYTLTITGVGQPVQLVSPAQSWKTHGGTLGALAIDIPLPGPQANNRHIIESRQGSVTEMTLTFDAQINPATFIPANIQVCGLNSTPGNPATAVLDGSGTVGTVTFAAGQIPNGELNTSAGDAYVLEVSTNVQSVGGDPMDTAANKVYFAASFGNVANTGILPNWQKVNANDRNQVVLNYTLTPSAAQAVAYDVWLQGIQAGRINATDANQIVLSYSSTDLDNSVLPACP